MSRDFKKWLSTFRSSIADYSYYVDFDKVYQSVDQIKIELNIMNSLIGSQNFDEDFRNIIIKYPSVKECIPILIAVRQEELEIQTSQGYRIYNFKNNNNDTDQYIEFMEQIGLKDMISHHIINNLVDYVLGIEVGLDSNARKNRGGHLMEDLLESYIQRLNVEYYKEMTTNEIEKKWHIDLSLLTNRDDVTKRFDFVIYTTNQIYVFETNFYKSGGSKLNETARSFKMIAEEISKIDGITFVWITDGVGWKSARKNLKETFDVLDTLYNINDLENNILENIIKY
ncbi:MAG: type II restriction endonuclease [Erysipelotrichaceae bacterium]|nr:type II restriction endonuclease [Erysipelotrichaceae bacterium]